MKLSASKHKQLQQICILTSHATANVSLLACLQKLPATLTLGTVTLISFTLVSYN